MESTNIIATIKGIDFRIGFTWNVGSPEVRFDSNNTGSPEEVEGVEEILSVEHNGEDFMTFFEDSYKLLETAILEARREFI
jgi:hypothetical protein